MYFISAIQEGTQQYASQNTSQIRIRSRQRSFILYKDFYYLRFSKLSSNEPQLFYVSPTVYCFLYWPYHQCPLLSLVLAVLVIAITLQKT